jgi:hypothetical protein
MSTWKPKFVFSGRLWGGVFLGLFLCSCGPRKNLNENLAKTLIEESLQKSAGSDVYHGHRIDHPQWAAEFSALSPVDFTEPRFQNLPQGSDALRVQLLKAGFLGKSIQEINYILPRHLSGEIGTQDSPGVFTSDERIDVSLHSSETGIVEGTWSTQPTSLADMKGPCKGGIISGMLMNDGSIQFSFAGGEWEMGGAFNQCYRVAPRFKMQPVVTGGNVELNGSSQSADYVFKLTADHPESIKKNWYSYDWTAKMSAFFPLGKGNGFDIGTIEVRSISSLVLTGSGIEATATFLYRTTPNDFGRVAYGGLYAEANGHANFSKKPNGDWILSSYQLTEHI